MFLNLNVQDRIGYHVRRRHKHIKKNRKKFLYVRVDQCSACRLVVVLDVLLLNWILRAVIIQNRDVLIPFFVFVIFFMIRTFFYFSS